MQTIQEILAGSAKMREQQLAEYFQLCDARDAVNATVAPVQAGLDKAILATQAARETELKLAAEIESLWGPDWFALKRRIGELARALGKIPPRTT